MFGGERKRESSKPAVAIRRAHHGSLDLLIAQSGDTSGPFSFDCGPPFELETEFAKEKNGASKVPISKLVAPIYKVSPTLTTNA